MKGNKVSIEEIAALLTIYFDNMAAMNAEDWLEIFSEEAVIHDPVGAPQKLVHKDSQQFFKVLSNFFEKMELSKDNIFFVENGAAVKWTMRLVGSRDGRDGSVTIHQDVSLYATSLREGETVNHQLADGRVAWVQVARGSVQLNDRSLSAGDGAAICLPAARSAIEQLEQIALQGTSNDAEVLLFDMVA